MGRRRVGLLGGVVLAVLLAALLIFMVLPGRKRRMHVSEVGLPAPPQRTRTIKVTEPKAAKPKPERSPQASEQIPKVYRGDRTITGYVVTGEKAPVPGAVVFCRPVGFTPCNKAQTDYLTTKADAEGHFTLSHLPVAAWYTFSASKYPLQSRDIDVGGNVAGRVAGQVVWDRPITIVVRHLVYVRVHCEDSNGKTLEMRGPCLFATMRGYIGDNLQGGIPSKGSKLEEAIEEYKGPDIVEVGVGTYDSASGDKKPWTLRKPGYYSRKVFPKRRHLEDWPRADTVELRRDDSDNRVTYKVIIPRIALPLNGEDGWCLNELRVTEWSERGVSGLTSRNNEFWEAPSAKFCIKGAGLGRLDTRVISSRDGETNVKFLSVELPQYGFLEVRYEVVPGHPCVVYLEELAGTGSAYQETPYPGCTRFGRIRVGNYTLRREWVPDTGASELDKEYGTVEVKAGLNVVRWR